jgi:hypothetical protein
MDTKPSKDYTHVAISVVLFCVAGIAYAVGYSSIAGFVAIGLVIELAAWAFLMFGGDRPYPEVQPPTAGTKTDPAPKK